MALEIPSWNNPLFGPPSSREKFRLRIDGWNSLNLLHSTHRSPWKGISQISHLSYPFIRSFLGNGSNIRFWLDSWASSQPFSSLLISIFNLSLKKSEVMLDFFHSSNWNLHLRRNIRDIDELSSLLYFISPLSPSPSGSDSRLRSLST